MIGLILAGYAVSVLLAMRWTYANFRPTDDLVCDDTNPYHGHDAMFGCYQGIHDELNLVSAVLSVGLFWPLILLGVAVFQAVTFKPRESATMRASRKDRELKQAEAELADATRKLRDAGVGGF